jgi:outer membrane protein
MNRTAPSLALSLLVVGWLAAPGWSAELKIAFVDLDKVFTEFNKTKRADLKLKDQAQEFNDERKELIDDYQKLEEAFNAIRDDAQNTALSEEARNKRRDEAEEKLVEMREFKSRIRRFDETRRKQLDDQTKRMRRELVEEITSAITVYARDEGFATVLDSSGQSLNGVPSILYVDNRYDITEKLIDRLNKTAKP